MAASADQESGWESQADVDACLRETGVTQDQVNRWRREGLLPPVTQQPLAYRGSEVRYPVGTCAQIRVAQALFRKKNRSEYVGWELWWRNFLVDEHHWRPRLIQAAGWGDKALRIFKLQSRRDDERESADTIVDRTVQAGSSNSFYVKIKRRVSQENLPALLGMLLDTASGDFEGAIPKDLDSPLKRAFDMEDFRDTDVPENSEPDPIQRWGARLTNELPSILRDIARVSRRYSLIQVSGFPKVELEAARDDVRRTLQIACDSYEAFSWLYGQSSFGLRLAAWVAQHSSPSAKAVFILVFAARRCDRHSVLSSEDIDRLAYDAAVLRDRLIKLRKLQQNDPRFSRVLAAKSVRRGLKNKVAARQLLNEIEAARVRT